MADLTGTVALLTGRRVKIGYQAGTKLLRCGASLIVVTRFPRDAAARCARLVGEYEGLRRYHLLPGSDRTTALDTVRPLPIPGLTDAATMSQTPLLPDELEAQSDLFPEGRLDQDLQQVDLRERNSWRLLQHEV